MKNIDLTANAWPDYELIDSGNNRKLERFGKYILIRPETQAIWLPKRPEAWKQAYAEFRFAGGKGSWQKKNMPDSWEIGWRDVRMTLRLTSFKHTGAFPEQAPNWDWTADRVASLAKKGGTPNVLNLFGYTGVASIAAAQAGARVTHVDASKQSNTWGKENATLSGVGDGIRWITDDALKFVVREGRRGASYDGIILDPPAFGRGADGEVWRIEEHLSALLAALKKIFSADPGSFFLLNGYAAGYSARSFAQSAENIFGELKAGEAGELHIAEKDSGRVVPSGIYVRFTW